MKEGGSRAPLAGGAGVVCLCVVASVVALPAQAGSRLGATDCPFHTSVPPELSPEAIGQMQLGEHVGRLRLRCRAARDTTVRLQSDAGQAYPGLVFQFDSLTVLALQYGVSVLDSGRAADGWMVFGTRATILDRVPLSASWIDLHAALGTAQASARGVLAVRFCSFPNAIMILTADPGAVVTKKGLVDLSSIPHDATIHHVFIMSRSLAGHLMGC